MRRLVLSLLVVLLAWAVTVAVWLRGCHENTDCRGVPLAAYYAVYAWTAALLMLGLAVIVVGAARRRASNRSAA